MTGAEIKRSHSKQTGGLVSTFGKLLRDAYQELSKNDPLRMAAATAFFTTFALAPILLILIQVLGLIFDPEKVSQNLFVQLRGMIGTESTRQIMKTLVAIRRMAQNWFVTIGGFLFLLFVATTLFKVVKSSLNQVWKIRVEKEQSIWQQMRTRFRSILVILIAGALFIVGLVAEGAQAFLGQYISRLSPTMAYYFNSFLGNLISIVIVTVWFAIVFRYLPNGRPAWSVALPGALFTSVLFSIGKYLLRWLLSYSNVNTFYGASGSVVLLLLFVFYSSLILYFGAAFTKIWGLYKNKPIRPLHGAVHYKLTETSLQEDLDDFEV